MKYLEITLHDNDFCNELNGLGQYLIEQITNNGGEFNINDNYPLFRDGIVKYLSAAYQLRKVIWWGKADNVGDVADYFDLRLKIRVIEENELKSWDNAEILYVPICTLDDVYHGVTWAIV